jgi:hypothetical protein
VNNDSRKTTPPTGLSFDGKGQCIGWRKLFFCFLFFFWFLKPQWYWLKMRTEGGKEIAGMLFLSSGFLLYASVAAAAAAATTTTTIPNCFRS